MSSSWIVVVGLQHRHEADPAEDRRSHVEDVEEILQDMSYFIERWYSEIFHWQLLVEALLRRCDGPRVRHYAGSEA